MSKASALANLLGRLVLPHYKLATTTVTGIPMKVRFILLYLVFFSNLFCSLLSAGQRSPL